MYLGLINYYEQFLIFLEVLNIFQDNKKLLKQIYFKTCFSHI